MSCIILLGQVRNSSTLLFSALVLRIFGAKRVQDEHSIENKMTGCEFFTRFPSLHSFLLQQVEKAAKELEENPKKCEKFMFQFLCILACLRNVLPSVAVISSVYNFHYFLFC